MSTSTAAYNYEYVGVTSDGVYVGADSTKKLGFYGTAPVAIAALSNAAIATSVAVSTTTGAITSWGFSTSTQANAIVSLVNELRAKLVALGLTS
jgi:hypothetical protein